MLKETTEETVETTVETTTETTTAEEEEEEAPSATSLLLDFVPLLLSLLTASVDENINGASGGHIALADVRAHLSPELSLLHYVVMHGGSVQCVLHGAMGVLGEVLSCLNVALGGEGGGEGGGVSLNGLANVATAAECAIELLNVATSGDR